jgi:hypothetical protein
VGGGDREAVAKAGGRGGIRGREGRGVFRLALQPSSPPARRSLRERGGRSAARVRRRDERRCHTLVAADTPAGVAVPRGEPAGDLGAPRSGRPWRATGALRGVSTSRCGARRAPASHCSWPIPPAHKSPAPAMEAAGVWKAPDHHRPPSGPSPHPSEIPGAQAAGAGWECGALAEEGAAASRSRTPAGGRVAAQFGQGC